MNDDFVSTVADQPGELTLIQIHTKMSGFSGTKGVVEVLGPKGGDGSCRWGRPSRQAAEPSPCVASMSGSDSEQIR